MLVFEDTQTRTVSQVSTSELVSKWSISTWLAILFQFFPFICRLDTFLRWDPPVVVATFGGTVKPAGTAGKAHQHRHTEGNTEEPPRISGTKKKQRLSHFITSLNISTKPDCEKWLLAKPAALNGHDLKSVPFHIYNWRKYSKAMSIKALLNASQMSSISNGIRRSFSMHTFRLSCTHTSPSTYTHPSLLFSVPSVTHYNCSHFSLELSELFFFFFWPINMTSHKKKLGLVLVPTVLIKHFPQWMCSTTTVCATALLV